MHQAVAQLSSCHCLQPLHRGMQRPRLLLQPNRRCHRKQQPAAQERALPSDRRRVKRHQL